MARFRRVSHVSLALALAGAGLASTAMAQSAGATGPAPAAAFPRGPEAPANAPNVLLVMTDDVGFGASSTFGGPIPTPTFDALAQNGVRYGAFHTTGICAPSRAALLTGRNPHRVGMGLLPEMATPDPGYTSVIPPSAATVARILQLNGYSTAAFGKYHVSPQWEGAPDGSGPHLPNRMGFDYFYGFLSAATDPWRPDLRENQNPVQPWAGNPGYVLDRDLADHTIEWLRQQQLHRPGQPFFAYYAPGTLHAPLGAPAEWIAKFRGKFDTGWDVLRQQIFERQQRLGIVPRGAVLTPMAEGTVKWESLSPDQKRIAARHMEVYAAMLAYADAQIGRVIDDLKRSGRLDNTLIIYIQGDNGASSEGGAKGIFNYSLSGNGIPEEESDTLARIDEMGGPTGPTAVPVGWARATDAPFPWNKGIASHLGATRNGMVISWPGHMADTRAVRYQFTHLNDIAPTIYQAAGIVPPAEVDGVRQMPFDGTSLLYTLSDPRQDERHREQYFEVYGNMGLYKDGWMLSSTPATGAYSLKMAETVKVNWELYHLSEDYSQSRDVARENPAKLAEMVARFDQVAEANNVKPIMRDKFSRVYGVDRGLALLRRGRFTLLPGPASYDQFYFPRINNRSWTAEAELVVTQGGSNGMIVTQGGEFAGWGLMILKGRPTFLYRLNDTDRNVTRIAAEAPLAPGQHRLGVRFVADTEDGWATGGLFTLLVDGKPAAEARIARSVAAAWAEDAQVGRDDGTPLTSDYQLPFAFEGTIDKVVIDTQKPVGNDAH